MTRLLIISAKDYIHQAAFQNSPLSCHTEIGVTNFCLYGLRVLCRATKHKDSPRRLVRQLPKLREGRHNEPDGTTSSNWNHKHYDASARAMQERALVGASLLQPYKRPCLSWRKPLKRSWIERLRDHPGWCMHCADHTTSQQMGSNSRTTCLPQS